MDKENRRVKRIFIWLLLLASVCAMAVSGYKLWEIRAMYARGDHSYEKLVHDVKDPSVSQTPSVSDGTKAEPGAVKIPKVNIDFKTLQAINPDAVAWLYCPDTVIDYPVMRADDYGYYLSHLPDGTYNANGSLFLDYNNPSDFSGGLNIVYGHNMNSGKMFGSLGKYKRQVHYDAHPYMYFYTLQGNYSIELLYGCVIGAGQWRDRAFMYESNRSSLLDYAAQHTTFVSNASYSEEDRIIALSTCSYEFDDARYVLIGILKPQQETLSR